MDNSLLTAIIVALFLGLMAGTCRSIRRNLTNRPVDQFRPGAVRLFIAIEFLLWGFMFFAVFISAPHPNTALVLMMLYGAILIASRMRYQEEVRSLNHSLGLLSQTNLSAVRLIEGISSGCRSDLARRSKVFVQRVQRGGSILEAARRSKLPLSTQTLISMQQPSRMLRDCADDFEKCVSEFQYEDFSNRSAPILQQFIYAFGIVFLAWVIGFLTRSLVPTWLGSFFEEMSIDADNQKVILDWVVQSANLVITVLAIWLSLAACIRWLPIGLVQYIPWFGSCALDRWRCDLLDSLAHGIHANQPLDQTFEMIERLTSVRWIRRRCKLASQSIQRGTTLPAALLQSQIINARQSQWIASAEKNLHLHQTVVQMSRDIQRRQDISWRLRATWVVPLATIGVGLFVLAHAGFMIHLMSTMIGGMS